MGKISVAQMSEMIEEEGFYHFFRYFPDSDIWRLPPRVRPFVRAYKRAVGDLDRAVEELESGKSITNKK